MQKLVFTNGGGNTIDLTSVSNGGYFGITNWEGLSGVGLNIQTQQVPFQDGGVFLDALMEQREISVTVAIQDNNDLSARYERKRELISALNPKLGEGVLVYTNDFLSRQIKAVPQLPIFENKNSNDSGTLKASVTFSCPSPYWEDLEDTVVSFKIGQQPILRNEGDVPCQIEMEWFTNYIKNGRVTNLTQNQKIKYEGELTNSLKIVTETGNKTATTEEIRYRISNLGNTIQSICNRKEQSLFVAVGLNGIILTSVDGKNWENTESGTTQSLFGITYSEELKLFVVVGNNGTILTSENGINWVTRTSGVSKILSSVIYVKDLSLFITVGYQGTILTSTDGINWDAQVSGVTTGSFDGITWGQNQCVVVGSSGRILVSSDGINWTIKSSGTSNTLASVTYSNDYNLFVVTGMGIVLTSNDGDTWTSIETGVANNILLNGVVYSTELKTFVIVGVYKTIIVSSDAEIWNIVASSTAGSLNDITYSDELGLFVTVGNNGAILISSNTENWESVTSEISASLYGVTNHQNLFVAVGNSRIYTSSDEKIWIERYRSSHSYRGVIYIPEISLFIAYGGEILTSPDGINWTSKYTGGMGQVQSITFSNELGIIVGVGDNGKVYTSNNGIDWAMSDVGHTSFLYAITYAEDIGLFVAVGSSGAIYTSDDGESWTYYPYASGTYNTLYDVIYTQKLFIAVGNNGTIVTSVNGINWVIRTSGTSNTLRDILFSSELTSFTTVGDEGTILTSSDGINWISRNSYISLDLYSVTYSMLKNRFVIVGETGTILYTDYFLKENQIQNISQDSDMNMNLGLGDNKFRINKDDGSMVVKIKFRQKYIGV